MDGCTWFKTAAVEELNNDLVVVMDRSIPSRSPVKASSSPAGGSSSTHLG